MSWKSFVYSLLTATALIAPIAKADPQGFTAEEIIQLQAIIDGAIGQAMSDPSMTDGNPQTQPPGTVIWSKQAPSLSEEQRVALGQMIDAAVRRARQGQPPAGSPTPPPQVATEEIGGDPIDPSMPQTDLTDELVSREMGFDVDGNRPLLDETTGPIRTALKQTDTGLNTAAASPGISNVQILAGTEGARVSLKLDQSSGAGDSLGATHYWSRSLVFSAPVDKNKPESTDLIGLDGLTNGFEVAYNASRIRTEGLGRPKRGQRSLLNQMPHDCLDLGIPIPKCDYSNLMHTLRSMAADPGNPRAAHAQALAARYELTGRAFVQGFRLKAGHDDMVYYDPTTLAKQTEDEIPWSAGVFIGRLTQNAYYSAGLDYQQSYKPAQAGTFCPTPDPVSSISRCVSGPLGEPTSNERHLANLEARWLLGERAVGLKVVRDFKNHHWGVDMPIYLFPNDKGLLSGGLRLAWTDVDQFSAGIFIGVPFKVFD